MTAPVLQEDGKNGSHRNAQDNSQNGVDDTGEADGDEHREDGCRGGEAHRALHDQRNQQVIFAPLNDVVDESHHESPEESILCDADEDRTEWILLGTRGGSRLLHHSVVRK